MGHAVGIVGLGVISRAYLETLALSPAIEVVAVADLDAERARDVAASLPDAAARTVDELVADPRVQTVLNLTTPAAHAGVALAAIAAGKDVFGEKPLTATLVEAEAVMRAAAERGVRVGCAPDTVLGTGVQTARDAVTRGLIGRPVAASATWVAPGHEAWHPAPDFYYRAGGGPLLDMGPYYLTSLVHLLGPVRAVQGAASRTRDTRRIATGPRAGEVIDVEIATHVTGILEHVDGALSTVVMSFDGAGTGAAPIEVHGESGSLALPDPNWFDGVVRHRAAASDHGGDDWVDLPASAGYQEGSRGVGLIDFVGGAARASGDLALHVLEVMTTLLASAESGERRAVSSRPAVPTLVPLTAAAQWRAAEAG
ncbi:Gfo/Idh/MocA family protein [Microbacterium sp. P05]|uniref:Gfo/Idh/MocA family protein n=1 Tax=Microbacterium sp. P05 TaxID=3366948 RepID=UPI003746D9B5